MASRLTVQRKWILAALLPGLGALFAIVAGCGGPSKPELWIYTSIYREVLDELKPRAAAALPGFALQWYKAGSEEVAARVTAELASGAGQADVLMTADIFWYSNLAVEDSLLPLPDDLLRLVPATVRESRGRYMTTRYAVMVLAVNEKKVPPELRPRSFKDLLRPELKGKMVMGDPLKSGTNFTTVALLSRKYGWEYFAGLRANEMLVDGGNSAVQRRVELGDHPIGIILMENLLKARKLNSDATMVLPAGDAVVIPSPIGVPASCRDRQAAFDFCRFIMSPPGQDTMVAGNMYPALPGQAPPPGAPPLDEVLKNALMADEATIREIAGDAEAIKEKFVQVMYE